MTTMTGVAQAAQVLNPPTESIPASAWMEASFGAIQVISPGELAGIEVWKTSFAAQYKDHRYYELVAATINPEFDYRYLVLSDERHRVRAIQPFILVRQDLLAGTGRGVQAAIARLRKVFPGLLTLRLLMVGCAAGMGHLSPADPQDQAWLAGALHEALDLCARALRVPVIVLKDFPAEYRRSLDYFARDGYARVPSMPMTHLALPYRSFDDYMERALSKATRKNLRRKFKKAATTLPLTMQVVDDITPYIDEAYPLYLQVMQRSALHFEKLTPAFLCRLGQTMPDRARFFIWRQEGRMVAFSVCMVRGKALYDEYLGMDYAVALDLHLYFLTLRDVLQWCIGQGIEHYHSTALNYDPKLHLRCQLMPLDLYVKHTSAIINPLFRRLVRWLEPTRHDPVLKEFANAGDLWADA